LLDRVVDGVVTFAMLAALMSSALRRHMVGLLTAVTTTCIVAAFACVLEVGKLLFVGRLPSSENLVLASTGALLGMTLVPVVVEWTPIRRHPEGALAGLALAVLVYSELTPFTFSFSSRAIIAQFVRVEWIPFLQYSRADPESALFDLWKKLLLSGFWGFSFAYWKDTTPLGAMRAGLVAGGLLEASQVLSVSRMPSLGDVLSLGLGAWIGGVIYDRCRTLGIIVGHRTAV
jgi:VanZ family protein